jgi:hypothetical protein
MAECMPLNRLEAPMSLQDAVRSQLIEIIEWTDDSRETLSYRFPDQDKEIKRGAKLIVRESQAAQFVQAFVFVEPERLACRAQINLDWCALMNLEGHFRHVG